MSGCTHQTVLLRHLGDSCKTIDILADELGLTHRQITNAAASLVGHDLLERVERGCFQLTEAGHAAARSGREVTSGPNGPLEHPRRAVRGSLRQRAWSAMRIQRRFTVQDILLAATQGDEVQADNNLRRYCRQLSRAGVLRQLPTRQAGSAPSSNGFVQYTLVRDLGHQAPSYRPKAQVVFDHNSGEELSL